MQRSDWQQRIDALLCCQTAHYPARAPDSKRTLHATSNPVLLLMPNSHDKALCRHRSDCCAHAARLQASKVCQQAQWASLPRSALSVLMRPWPCCLASMHAPYQTRLQVYTLLSAQLSADFMSGRCLLAFYAECACDGFFFVSELPCNTSQQDKTSEET